MSSSSSKQPLRLLMVAVGMLAMAAVVSSAVQHNYADALSKSILFFEGQRSGRLPHTQRMKWRKDSALRDGLDVNVSLLIPFSLPFAWCSRHANKSSCI